MKDQYRFLEQPFFKRGLILHYFNMLRLKELTDITSDRFGFSIPSWCPALSTTRTRYAGY